MYKYNVVSIVFKTWGNNTRRNVTNSEYRWL